MHYNATFAGGVSLGWGLRLRLSSGFDFDGRGIGHQYFLISLGTTGAFINIDALPKEEY